jgi:hypothetical protein
MKSTQVLLTHAWPQYPVGDGEKWPEEGALIIIPFFS